MKKLKLKLRKQRGENFNTKEILMQTKIFEISNSIVKNIYPELENCKILGILSYTYYHYKKQLQIIKELNVYQKYIDNYISKLNSKEIEKLNIMKKMEFEFIKNIK